MPVIGLLTSRAAGDAPQLLAAFRQGLKDTGYPSCGFGYWVIGQQIEVFYVSSGREIETAFTTLVQRGAGALLVGGGAFLLSHRERIAALAARHRIPAIYVQRDYVEVGGLMSYAPSIPDTYRQAGIYAGRILKGEKPGDLPVMLPTKFELVINAQTARMFGLTVPPTLIATADEVIEPFRRWRRRVGALTRSAPCLICALG